ncbi:MAG: hypothetical protein CMF74_06095 [Maricaulis sp.]|jgi:hypothetical protein|nr:hypothetical protein [Maricaulis sp.]HAQ35740.1 DUF1476 domain-containing protein [Alphaproteobacteria bacterium]
MTSMDDREKAFENKYAHDQALEFKAVARRNKLLGLWAAGLMGLEGDAATEYGKAVVKADFEEAGHEDVYRKVKGDLDAKGVEMSEHLLRKQMDDLLITARQQVQAEG